MLADPQIFLQFPREPYTHANTAVSVVTAIQHSTNTCVIELVSMETAASMAVPGMPLHFSRTI